MLEKTSKIQKQYSNIIKTIFVKHHKKNLAKPCHRSWNGPAVLHQSMLSWECSESMVIAVIRGMETRERKRRGATCAMKGGRTESGWGCLGYRGSVVGWTLSDHFCEGAWPWIFQAAVGDASTCPPQADGCGCQGPQFACFVEEDWRRAQVRHLSGSRVRSVCGGDVGDISEMLYRTLIGKRRNSAHAPQPFLLLRWPRGRIPPFESAS